MIRKYDKVLVKWVDIVADLHSENKIVPCQAESLGFVESNTKEYLRLVTSRYIDDKELADRIVIPKGWIKEIIKL